MSYGQEFTIDAALRAKKAMPNSAAAYQALVAHANAHARATADADAVTNVDRGEYAFLSGCSDRQLAKLRECAARYRRFSKVFVAAIGAAANCGRVWVDAYPVTKSVEFLQGVTPTALAACFTDAPADKESGFLFISRSGETVETLTQFAALAELCAAANRNPADCFTVLVGGGATCPLAQAATAANVPIYHLNGDISGRFSIFNEAGLLPAMIANIDPAPLLAAARRTAAAALKRADSEPLKSAATIFALYQRGFTTAVIANYDPNLDALARWQCQMYGESLGKGGRGITPLAASCPADQHSQLQLWLDGPKDKFITIIDRDPPANDKFSPSMNKRLLATHNRLKGAVCQSLAAAGVPIRVIKADELAALAMHCLLETWFLAHFFAVNPFDQPAVAATRAISAAE